MTKQSKDKDLHTLSLACEIECKDHVSELPYNRECKMMCHVRLHFTKESIGAAYNAYS